MKNVHIFSGALLNIVVLAALLLVGTGRMSAQYAELEKLEKAANKAISKGNSVLADSLYRQYVRVFRTSGQEKNFHYTTILEFLRKRCVNKGMFDEAVSLQEEVVEVRRTARDCINKQWATSICDLANIYFRKGDVEKAIETGLTAAEKMKRAFGKKHHNYNVGLTSLATFYFERGNPGDDEQALSLAEQSIKYIKKDTRDYVITLDLLVACYSQTRQYDKASKLSAKSRKAARKRFAEDGAGYARLLNNQAVRLSKLGNYDEAISYMLEAKAYYEKAHQEHTREYTRTLTSLATFFSHKQKYQQTIDILQQVRPVIKELFGENSVEYVNCIGNLSSAYKGIGDMEKADEMAHESDRLSQKIDTKNSLKFAHSLTNQAAVFASNGNYKRAQERQMQAIDIYKNRSDSLKVAFAMSGLANYQFHDGQRVLGLKTANEALDIYARNGQYTHENAQALNNAAILYYHNGDFDKAAEYGRASIQIYRETKDTLNAIFARIMCNNAMFCFCKDSLEKAEDMSLKALKISVSILGKDHPDNVPLLYNIAVYQNANGKNGQALKTYQEALAIQSGEVRDNFLHLTSQEREKFWNKKSYVFKYAPLLAYINRDNPAFDFINTEAYNTLLFTKGILLNSDIDFRNLLRRTNNRQLLEKYNRAETLRAEEETLLRVNASRRDNGRLKKIKEELYQLERSLVKGCKEYGQFTESLNINTKQVAQALANDEVAIEFSDFFIKGLGNTYVAFVLRHGQTRPELVRLFSDADLSALKYNGGRNDFFQALKDVEGVNRIYDDPALGHLVWGKLLPYLKGIRNIYFSPTSLFYQLGIEYLYANDAERIGDLFNVYRMSSTKFLVNRGPAAKIQKAVVYGGLKYDMTIEELTQQHNHQSTGLDYLLCMNNTDGDEAGDMQRTLELLSTRGSVKYLEGTLQEAYNITEQFLQNNITTKIYTNEEGTEETFKSLSGQSHDVLHIATHGFCFTEQEMKESGKQYLFMSEELDNLNSASNYSGLLMSGAGCVLDGKVLPEGIENGILTSREIAQVDLGNTGLVVLSACQTGLGEIMEDGVFGIQRSFKKAGAHSLMMSLWKVSDMATELMMTKFYKYLLQGKSRHEAFRLSQQAVRSAGFSQPYYWASFILLDGNQ